MLLSPSLLSFTWWYFCYLFSHNRAYDLRDNWCKLSLQVVTNLCIFDEFMANKYILIWCCIEMSLVRMLTFGMHVSADVHWRTHYNFVNLFWKVHFVIQCFSWSQLFYEIHHNYIFNHFFAEVEQEVCSVNWRWQHICMFDCGPNEINVAVHVCGRSEFCSLLFTMYLIHIFCITINFIFYFYF